MKQYTRKNNLSIKKLYQEGFNKIFLVNRILYLEQDSQNQKIYLRYFDTYEHIFYKSIEIKNKTQLKELIKEGINKDIKYLQNLKKKLKL